eukprot:CAMPEP_0174855912 /NCGR_PEP_ID=MMETSP1114-20130205/34581_1 /TAXON_ID=312471 /ORGANISM="Neobodo designis, Strain CCAP 1951/1" /LENGTH=236 /DNA_ID=CAMNT_0016090685 /DNA_START=35 /DNA_END=745 /DNA_ORIENTATION=+
MAQSPIVVHGDPISQPTRAVMWVLAMKGVKHEMRRVNPLRGEAEKDEYLRKFPSGLIPGVEVDGLHLTESHAILVYLAETRGWDDLYPSKDAAKRAKVNMWLHWHHTNARLLTPTMVRPLFVGVLSGMPPSEETIKKAQKRSNKLLREMELVMNHGGLKHGKFLCGDAPTLADIAIYCEVDQIEGLGLPLNLDAVAPTVAAWVKRMQALPHHDEVRALFPRMRARLAKALPTLSKL